MSARRGAAVAALVVASVVGVATARQLSIGGVEAAAAEAAAARSDWPAVIAHARATAEAVAPGSPWPARGWQRLEAVGHDAEARGDDATALLAYGAMRSAALATRGLGSGWERRRLQAEEGLARVAAARRDAFAAATTVPVRDALRAEEPPPALLFALLAASAVAALSGLARLAWLGDAATRARAAQAVAAAGVVVYALVALTR